MNGKLMFVERTVDNSILAFQQLLSDADLPSYPGKDRYPSVFEFIDHPFHDGIVEIITAEVCITIRSFYFKYAIA